MPPKKGTSAAKRRGPSKSGSSRATKGKSGPARRKGGSAKGGSTKGGSTKGRGGRVRGHRLWRWRRPIFVLFLVFLLCLSAFGYWLSQIPLPDEDPLLQTTFICAADVAEGCDRENSMAQLSGGEDRVSVTYDELPEVLVQSVLAAEDRDFFAHSGLDPVGIGRALWADIRSRDIEQGGSTITQQYVKNAFLTNDRTLTRKVREAVLAVKIEQELGKEEILLRYLNTIYFGRGAYGVQAASRAYFGKDVQEIGLAESAYLAGLIRAPESADAWREEDRQTPTAVAQREEAERRRTSVLDAMLEEGFIDQAAHDAAEDTPFEDPYLLVRQEGTNFGVVKGSDVGTEYFVEYVRRELREQGFTDAQIFGGGLRVYTTLDYEMQAAAYNAISETLDQEDDPDASLVALDSGGRVLAMAGGRSWEQSKVNLAVGTAGGGTGRQPGSSFKPFVLAEAMRQGISVESLFTSPGQVTVPGADDGGPWKVSNFDRADQGNLTLIEATQKSSNTVYAQLMDVVGPANVATLANQAGVSAELPQVHALALGAGEVSVLDMASGFSTFPNMGEHVDPIVIIRVEDSDGNVLETPSPGRTRVLDEVQAQSMNFVLRQVVEAGTGKAAAFGGPAAGKTGTAQDFRDAWFVGYTCELTAAVWVGYVEPEEDGSARYMDDVRGEEVTGGTLPAEVWQDFMDRAADGYDEGCSFRAPGRFPGEIINEELATTTTTEGDTTTSSPSTTGSTTTTEAPATTAPPTTEAPATTLPPGSTTVPLGPGP